MEFYKTQKMKKMIDFNENEINKKVLLENGDKKCILFALKKEQKLPSHFSQVDAFIYILEGEVKYILETPEQKEFELKKGEILKFKKEDKHSLYAQKDSKFIVVRI